MEFFNGSVVPYLFLATFVIVLVYGVMQFRKTKKAQREHHRSADAMVHGEPRTPQGKAEAGSTRRS